MHTPGPKQPFFDTHAVRQLAQQSFAVFLVGIVVYSFAGAAVVHGAFSEDYVNLEADTGYKDVRYLVYETPAFETPFDAALTSVSTAGTYNDSYLSLSWLQTATVTPTETVKRGQELEVAHVSSGAINVSATSGTSSFFVNTSAKTVGVKNATGGWLFATYTPNPYGLTVVQVKWENIFYWQISDQNLTAVASGNLNKYLVDEFASFTIKSVKGASTSTKLDWAFVVTPTTQDVPSAMGIDMSELDMGEKLDALFRGEEITPSDLGLNGTSRSAQADEMVDLDEYKIQDFAAAVNASNFARNFSFVAESHNERNEYQVHAVGWADFKASALASLKINLANAHTVEPSDVHVVDYRVTTVDVEHHVNSKLVEELDKIWNEDLPALAAANGAIVETEEITVPDEEGLLGATAGGYVTGGWKTKTKTTWKSIKFKAQSGYKNTIDSVKKKTSKVMGAGAVKVGGAINKFHALKSATNQKIGDKIKGVGGFFKKGADRVKGLGSGAVNLGHKIVAKAGEIAKTGGTKVKNAIGGAGAKLKAGAKWVGEKTVGAVSAVGKGIKKLFMFLIIGALVVLLLLIALPRILDNAIEGGGRPQYRMGGR